LYYDFYYVKKEISQHKLLFVLLPVKKSVRNILNWFPIVKKYIFLSTINAKRGRKCGFPSSSTVARKEKYLPFVRTSVIVIG